MNEWISVKDKEIPKGVFLLMYVRRNAKPYRFFVGCLYNTRDLFIEGPGDFDIYVPVEDITYWMKLYEPQELENE